MRPYSCHDYQVHRCHISWLISGTFSRGHDDISFHSLPGRARQEEPQLRHIKWWSQNSVKERHCQDSERFVSV
ncbi:hypothetical protein GBAR_LOCUS15034, partial [Geodia barretti]